MPASRITVGPPSPVTQACSFRPPMSTSLPGGGLLRALRCDATAWNIVNGNRIEASTVRIHLSLRAISVIVYSHPFSMSRLFLFIVGEKQLPIKCQFAFQSFIFSASRCKEKRDAALHEGCISLPLYPSSAAYTALCALLLNKSRRRSRPRLSPASYRRSH